MPESLNNEFENEHSIEDEDILEADSIDSLFDEEYDEEYEYDDNFSTSDFVIVSLIDTWKSQQEANRELKTKYGKWVMRLLFAEMLFISGILLAVGTGILNFDEWVINAFVVTVFGQIMGVVYIIVKNLFSDGNEIIDIIKEYIK